METEELSLDEFQRPRIYSHQMSIVHPGRDFWDWVAVKAKERDDLDNAAGLEHTSYDTEALSFTERHFYGIAGEAGN